MKWLTILFFLCVLTLYSSGQSLQTNSGQNLSHYTIDSIEKKISEYHNRLKRDTIGRFTTLNYKWIADCYNELGDTSIAKNYLRLAITEGILDFGIYKRRLFQEIAAPFLKNRQFDSLLHYYTIIESKLPRRITCSMGWFDIFKEYRYWGMVALNENGMSDSAIKVFMPYAFEPNYSSDGSEISTHHYYENDYHCQVIYFLKLLIEKNDLALISKNLSHLDLAGFEARKGQEDKYCTYNMVHNIPFGDNSFEIYGWSISCNEYEAKKSENDQHFKDFVYEKITSSFLYNYFFQNQFY